MPELPLDDYEWINLREALDAAMRDHEQGPNPLQAINTGDWLNHLRIRLHQYQPQQAPNQDADQMVDASRDIAYVKTSELGRAILDARWHTHRRKAG